MSVALEVPRIGSLVGEAVALEVARGCFARAKSLSRQLGPLAALELDDCDDEALAQTPVYRHLRRLHAWAQLGAGEEDGVERVLREVLAVLLPRSSGLGDDASVEELLGEVSEVDAVGVVCLAAWARLEVARGHRIDGRCLAALAGLSQSWLRALSRANELRPATTPASKVGTLYDARDVARFLAARGVPGFAR